MESSIPWFHHGAMAKRFKLGEVVTLRHPQESKWKLDKIINEHEQQMEKAYTTEMAISYASIKFACHKVTDPKTIGMMRIYMQIPSYETDREKAETRAKEAMPDSIHKELKAYKMLSEHPNATRFSPRLFGWKETIQKEEDDWPVPGGFLTGFVWELVSGQRLWNYDEDMKWFHEETDLPERNLIRKQFKESFIALDSVGIKPKPSHASKLVWNRKSQRLYWVGFADWNTATHEPWTDVWYQIFRLVQVPWDDQTRLHEWDGRTDRWCW